MLPTPVFWPGEFHGLYTPWCCKESDMTERPSLSLLLLLSVNNLAEHLRELREIIYLSLLFTIKDTCQG